MPIVYLEQHHMFEIRTKRSSYLFGINEKGTVQHLYWGEPVVASECRFLLKGRQHSSFDADIDREMEEFGGWGGSHYAEPGLKVEFGDGVRDLKLDYSGYELTGDNELMIRLVDRYYAFWVDVHYRAFPEHDVIERFVRVHNGEDQPVRVEQAIVAIWSVLELPNYRMTHVRFLFVREEHFKRARNAGSSSAALDIFIEEKDTEDEEYTVDKDDCIKVKTILHSFLSNY